MLNIKLITVVRHGREYHLSVQKLDNGVKIAGTLWTAPMPKDLSPNDLRWIESFAAATWDKEFNAIDLDSHYAHEAAQLDQKIVYPGKDPDFTFPEEN